MNMYALKHMETLAIQYEWQKMFLIKVVTHAVIRKQHCKAIFF